MKDKCARCQGHHQFAVVGYLWLQGRRLSLIPSIHDSLASAQSEYPIPDTVTAVVPANMPWLALPWLWTQVAIRSLKARQAA